jgi:hypothetical protein
MKLFPLAFLFVATASWAQQSGTDAHADPEWKADPAEASMMGSDDEAVRKGFTRFRNTVPASFQGTYRKSLSECGQPAESALVIRATKMHMPSSEADVQRVRVDGSRKIVVTSIFDGDGQVWEKTQTILLGKGGQSIAFQSEAGPDTRVRCPR